MRTGSEKQVPVHGNRTADWDISDRDHPTMSTACDDLGEHTVVELGVIRLPKPYGSGTESLVRPA